jgi:hypothetical protein
VIHEIKSGWAPPSLHVDLRRAQGCEPAIYTMADIDRFAAMSEFKAWLVVHELPISPGWWCNGWTPLSSWGYCRRNNCWLSGLGGLIGSSMIHLIDRAQRPHCAVQPR